MGFNCGIVGLPNVGKSTIFNVLTEKALAEASNYPFCTIEPNVGRVGVPDERLEKLASISKSKKIIPTQLEFVDIAGLVKGASNGEGLGNQFLGHIRGVDAIVHVVRCFEDDNITHVEGTVDPIRDIDIIDTELLLADIESLERRLNSNEKKIRSGDKQAKEQKPLIELLIEHLNSGFPARTAIISNDQKELLKQLQLLTTKPVLYIGNISEKLSKNEYSEKVEKYAKNIGAPFVELSAAIETEILEIENEIEKREFLDALGLKESGLSKVIRKGYELLDLLTFFTIGPKEAHAWTIKENSKSPEAAGVIHSDFERGFICAEVIAYEDYINCNGELEAKNQGKARIEGKNYIVKDGDIMHFRFNV